MKKKDKIIIIGGGLTGLGAAYRLRDLGYKNWIMYEKNAFCGGLSSTFKDEKGFLWDVGGHVIHSHYKYFDRFLSEVLKKDFYRHQRESWIKTPDSWVPYPFQNNLRYLTKEAQLECLLGAAKADIGKAKKAKNFEEWIINVFGYGIAKHFLFPDNLKRWAAPLNKMDKGWIADRISIVDFKRILENLIYEKNDISWGPNNTFIFPKFGGTGEISSRAAEFLKDNILSSREVKSVDLAQKQIIFNNGQKDKFDYLISTIPLDRFLKLNKNVPKKLITLVNRLACNNILVVGIGLKKEIKTTKCWAYFTDPDIPFYRLSYFHNYSPFNVPEGNPQKFSSLMCEVSYSRYKKEDKESVAEGCIRGLIKSGIINESDRKKIISETVYDIPYAYPIPTLGRDKILKNVQLFLMKNNIYSRGRFGAWKYEIGNMDHSFMQGVEAVDKILKNKKETVWSL
ncbi:FAD-dependent oxidoreductase [Candidatus Falkowbacteria bacterium]|nr:FAD-dependent oxidoreductase [Candidatus Falkowbacteria bacterium]